jgi:hypothetical protein
MMPPDPSPEPLSAKRAVLCSREHASRVADQIFAITQRACVIRTGDPLQPYRAAPAAARSEDVEVLLCV